MHKLRNECRWDYMANSGVAGSSPAPREWVVQAVEHRQSHQPLSLHLFKPRTVDTVCKIKTVNALDTTGTRWLEPSLQQCRSVRTLVTVAPFWRMQVELHPF